jgi:hypothetical protein
MREFMRASRKPAAEVIEAGKSRGYSDSELRAAKQELEIKSVKQTVRGPWFWYLPEHIGNKPQGTAKTEDVASIPEMANKNTGNSRIPAMTGVSGDGRELPPAGKSKNNSDKSGINSQGGFDWVLAMLLAAIAASLGVLAVVAGGGQIQPGIKK